METFQSAMKQRLSSHGLTQISMWALAIEVAKDFATSPSQLKWYIRANKLFLQGWAKEDPTSRFLNKKTIIKAINDRLKKHNFEYELMDVRLTI